MKTWGDLMSNLASGVEFRNTQGESKKILLKQFARILSVIMCRAILLKKVL